MADFHDTHSSAVLLIGNGSPDTLDDVPTYLNLMMNGRLPDPRVVDDMVERFRQIGGQSPLLDITQRIAAQLEEAADLPVYIAMRYWYPFIKDIVLQMLTDGIDHIITIPLLPHFSILTVGQYRNELTNVIDAAGEDIALDFVEHWHDCDEYIDAGAAQVTSAIGQSQAHIIFAARNLPNVILEHDDPYPDQIVNTAQAIATRLKLPDERWQLAYHSAADNTMQWLQPTIEDTLLELAGRDEADVLIVPISSVIDHIDTLYDIDIELMQFAQANGIRLERLASFNDGDVMLAIMTRLVDDHLPRN